MIKKKSVPEDILITFNHSLYETVAEVLGHLLKERDLKFGLIDTISRGKLAHDLIEAGFGDRIITNLYAKNLKEALEVTGIEKSSSLQEADNDALAILLAERVAPKNGIGLAMLGPLEDRSTYIALCGLDDLRLNKKGLNYRDTSFFRNWLVIQGMDWIRRAVLGEMTSPVDWK